MTVAIPSGIDPALEPLLATVLDAVIIMTSEGIIAGWNDVAERTFGWQRSEAVGRSLAEIIIPEEHRNAHSRGMERLARGGQPRVLDRLIEITALHRSGRAMPIELSITTSPSSHGDIYIGFIRDITERKETEAKIARQALKNRLMYEIASLAADSESFEEALVRVLGAICEITGWPVGHAFVVPTDSPHSLQCTGVWFEARPGIADQIRKRTDEIEFGSGIGLPGAILDTGEPQWVSDTASDENFPRKGSGFRGAFGFPLKSEGKIVAILEFFSVSPSLPDQGILQIVQALGEQVGRVFERKRTHDHQQLLLQELNHRVKNILSVIQAVAHQTFKGVQTAEEAYQVFIGRLRAIASAQDLLVSQKMQGATLRGIIKEALLGSGVDAARTKMEGPDVSVSPKSALTISLAVHELCTNALKYGAFSNLEGEVTIHWGTDGDRRFYFEWKESGGPPVSPPERKGFGSNLIERGLASELGGKIAIDYHRDGVVYRFIGASRKRHP